MKKIINHPADVIEDYIVGLVMGAPHLARVADWPVILRAPEARKHGDKVAVISGGGSGHEPAHAGYVGRGMLDAAVLGPVFTSPSVDAVYAAIRAVEPAAGVILVVKNYTGDRLNFGLAAELARAAGTRVELIFVSDDAALGKGSRAGRRGLTAAVLVHKIVGAAAERGWDMDRILEVARTFLDGAATMGLALGPCSLPGAIRPNFELADDEVEWGLGIHGEAGSERGTLASSAAIAARLIDVIVDDRRIRAGDDVVALVNGLGGTPDLELRILQGDVLRELSNRGVRARMTWAGDFLTALETPGASLTVAKVDRDALELLADEADVLAFPRATRLLSSDGPTPVPALTLPTQPSGATGPSRAEVVGVADVTDAIAEALIAAEPRLTELDRTVGDGDLGTNLARAADVMRARRDTLASLPTVGDYLAAVSDLLRREVGGTSGPLYSLFVLAMGERLRGPTPPTSADWVAAFAAGVRRIREIGGAEPGDSTMIDALQPAVDALADADESADLLGLAAAAARRGADATAALKPALGRSSYLGHRAVGVPDPGAVAIAIQLEAAQTALARRSVS